MVSRSLRTIVVHSRSSAVSFSHRTSGHCKPTLCVRVMSIITASTPFGPADSLREPDWSAPRKTPDVHPYAPIKHPRTPPRAPPARPRTGLVHAPYTLRTGPGAGTHAKGHRNVREGAAVPPAASCAARGWGVRWEHGRVTDARHHTPQVVAHRGASEAAPEHTLAAYARAIEEGADALECDVRLTADGHLVCVHDRRVNRTSNGRGAVSALELAELAALDFGSWKGRDEAEESPDWDPETTSVLTLERLLELLVDTNASGRRLELAVETKHPTRWAGQVEERLIHLLERFGLTGKTGVAEDGEGTGDPFRTAPSPVRVMSFSARSLHRVQALAPLLPTVHLTQFASPGTARAACPRGCGSRARASGSSAITPRTWHACRRRGTRCTCGPSTIRRTWTCACGSVSTR